MKNIMDIQAVILAGGLGTRLRGVVADKPKILAPVNGKPFVSYLFSQLIAVGIREAVLCTGYLGEQVEAAFGKKWKTLNLLYSKEIQPFGTAGALRSALPFLKSEILLVMNGDSYFGCNLEEAFTWHVSKKAAATILLTDVPNAARYGTVVVDADGKVLRFEEKNAFSKVGAQHAAPLQINAGIYFIKKDLLSSIPENRAVSIEKETFPGWVGKSLYGYRTDGAFLDIGSPESYASADVFLRGKYENPHHRHHRHGRQPFGRLHFTK
jgi:NDP-sugar pyrophosphorylase family protein